MLHPAIPASLLALAAPAFASLGDGPGQLDGVQVAQVTVHERIIIRVPRMGPARAAPIPAPIRWKEKKGPKCIAAADLGGALIAEPGAVDLVLAGGKRLRARLDDDCGPMDFYNGFYLRPAADGQVCADRDVIRMRSGASCGIATFRTLVAK
ncbi:hypothetical protein M9979_12855 [Sphingomonas sp. RP10(2022)]|uniref:Uncharacterized protein n=1 Tax=Sphingomonas liriopis TaxID=2949094 RepID=A0A9X2HUJ2_9SPHN|nr:hypothetical protein [Sphingomonas liriopis]MCP3735764.1 hypothetical protein [Sphingomonas liriopis]